MTPIRPTCTSLCKHLDRLTSTSALLRTLLLIKNTTDNAKRPVAVGGRALRPRPLPDPRLLLAKHLLAPLRMLKSSEARRRQPPQTCTIPNAQGGQRC